MLIQFSFFRKLVRAACGLEQFQSRGVHVCLERFHPAKGKRTATHFFFERWRLGRRRKGFAFRVQRTIRFEPPARRSSYESTLANAQRCAQKLRHSNNSRNGAHASHAGADPRRNDHHERNRR